LESSEGGEGCGIIDFSTAISSFGGSWAAGSGGGREGVVVVSGTVLDCSSVIFAHSGDSELSAQSDGKKAVSCLGVLKIVWSKYICREIEEEERVGWDIMVEGR